MATLIPNKKTRGIKQVRLSDETFARLRKIKARTGQSMGEIVDLAIQKVRVGRAGK